MMDRLPSPLPEKIMERCLTTDIIRFAQTYRRFQEAAERLTFRKLVVRLDDLQKSDDIEKDVRALFRYDHRIRSVREIYFVSLLHKYGERESVHPVTPAKHGETSGSFSKEIMAVFSFLSSLLTIGRDILQDTSPKIIIQATNHVPDWGAGVDRWTPPFFYRFVEWRLNESLPYGQSTIRLNLPADFATEGFSFIRKLRLGSNAIDERFLSPYAWLPILERLGSLEEPYWFISDHPIQDLERRRRKRSEYAETIASFPSSLKKLELTTKCRRRGILRDEDAPVTLFPGESEDQFTKVFFQVTQGLEHVDARGVLGSPQLFWPKDPSSEQSLPFWPHLKTLTLHFYPATPEGKWLFERDPIAGQQDAWYPGQSHFPEEMYATRCYRCWPNQDLLDELYLAVARAVARMPQLRSLSLSGLMYDGIKYFCTEFHTFQLEVKGRTATATWSHTPEFVPSGRVLQAWEQAASERDLELTTNFTHSGKEMMFVRPFYRIDDWRNALTGYI